MIGLDLLVGIPVVAAFCLGGDVGIDAQWLIPTLVGTAGLFLGGLCALAGALCRGLLARRAARVFQWIGMVGGVLLVASLLMHLQLPLLSYTPLLVLSLGVLALILFAAALLSWHIDRSPAPQR